MAAAAAALPYVLKVPKYAKLLYQSKHFLPLLLGAGYLGSEAIGEFGRAGERGIAREQVELQNLLAKASAEATERTVKESRARTKEYIEALMKAQREERKEARDIAAIESFTQSQDRQMALIINAMQALSQRQMGASTAAPGAGGMLSLMRGGGY